MMYFLSGEEICGTVSPAFCAMSSNTGADCAKQGTESAAQTANKERSVFENPARVQKSSDLTNSLPVLRINPSPTSPLFVVISAARRNRRVPHISILKCKHPAQMLNEATKESEATMTRAPV
jgi:hypothetical protein